MSILSTIFKINPNQNHVCRIPHPEGGSLEIRTSGNITPGEGYRIATSNCKLDMFSASMEDFAGFFAEAKAGPSAAEE